MEVNFSNKHLGKRKMTKDSERKLLFITLLLTILLVSSAYASLVPIVNAAELNIQEKTIDVLNDVVDINTEEYATFPSSQLDTQYLSLPQKQAD
jgi:cytochrome c oxidase assembly protein Cox11